MKYYLLKLLTNAQGQDGSAIAVYESRNAAIVAFHQTLATYHNAQDVKFAVVQVLNEMGGVELSETVDHNVTEETPTE